jgi:hypothetical protein
MNNAAALHELNRALAHFRRRQDHTPTPHSAREIAQMQVLAEYLHAPHDFSQNEQGLHAVPFTRKAA